MKTTEERASLKNLIERVRVGMVTTIDGAGALRSRPLPTLELDDDGLLWLLVAAGNADMAAMNRENSRVGIAYADPNVQDYASVAGRGAIACSQEKIRAHWNAWVELWFPQGIDTPNLALLCVTIEDAEYWEAPGGEARRVQDIGKAASHPESAALDERTRVPRILR